MDETVSYHFATVKQRRENRHEMYIAEKPRLFSLKYLNAIFFISDYQLTLRQQPKQSRMCGVGEKGKHYSTFERYRTNIFLVCS